MGPAAYEAAAGLGGGESGASGLDGETAAKRAVPTFCESSMDNRLWSNPVGITLRMPY
jgi:hypothetical protein